MEVLETYVLDCFSRVPTNNLPADDFKGFAEGVYDTDEFKRMYYVKPVKDVCQVQAPLKENVPQNITQFWL